MIQWALFPPLVQEYSPRKWKQIHLRMYVMPLFQLGLTEMPTSIGATAWNLGLDLELQMSAELYLQIGDLSKQTLSNSVI